MDKVGGEEQDPTIELQNERDDAIKRFFFPVYGLFVDFLAWDDPCHSRAGSKQSPPRTLEKARSDKRAGWRYLPNSQL